MFGVVLFEFLFASDSFYSVTDLDLICWGCQISHWNIFNWFQEITIINN